MKYKIITVALVTGALLLLSELLFCQNPWIISASDWAKNSYYGVTVSNGTIGVVSSSEPLKIKEIVLAGVYDKYGRGCVSNFLPNINPLDVALSINGADLKSSNISDYVQQLDMYRGEFRASFKYLDIAEVEYNYRTLRHLPHCLLMEVRIHAHKAFSMVFQNQHITPVPLKDTENYYNEIDFHHMLGMRLPLMTTVAKSPSGDVEFAATSSFLFEEKLGQEPRIMHQTRRTDTHVMKFTRELAAGEEYVVTILASLTSSKHNSDPRNQAERMLSFMRLQGRDKLLDMHRDRWAKLWESDIVIDGCPQDQQDIHNMLYHLYSFVREGTDQSPSPMGLSGLGYNGHVFWDSEIWIFPVLLLLHPEFAESMLEYRYQRLDAACRNAVDFGYDGALFPWESADSGEEECPITALGGVSQHHITADVAIAAWNYYQVTGDKVWLLEKGWPILQKTAEFWVSRVERSVDGREYNIKNVMCADEWAINVDNNAYTNAAAKCNLEYAALCAEKLGKEPPSSWRAIASHLRFSKMENGVTREHDTYNGEEIKQADVNLLAYPLKLITDKKQIRKDLDYYSKKIPQRNTPALASAIFSILCTQMGNIDEAYYWLKDAYQQNQRPPFHVFAEFKGGNNPYFITGAGGVLQAIIMGFGGVEIDPKGGLGFGKGMLPPSWKKLTIKGLGPEKKEITIRR